MNASRLIMRLIAVLAGLIMISLCAGQVLSPGPASQKVSKANASQKTVEMRIAGMTCAACAKGLEASIRNLAGILKVTVDYKAGQAVVRFDSSS